MPEEEAVLAEIENLAKQGVLGVPQYYPAGRVMFPYTAWPVINTDMLPEWIENNYKNWGEIRFYEMES